MSKNSDRLRHSGGGMIMCQNANVAGTYGLRAARREIADEIVAAVNFCRGHGIDPSSPDPLRAYRETVCREQREACAKAAHDVVCVKYRMVGPLKRDLESAVQNALRDSAIPAQETE